jgi:hypothetical protein
MAAFPTDRGGTRPYLESWDCKSYLLTWLCAITTRLQLHRDIKLTNIFIGALRYHSLAVTELLIKTADAKGDCKGE